MDAWIIICLTNNGFNRRTPERNGGRNHFFDRSMDFDPNEPYMKEILIGSEACPERDLGTRPVDFHRPSVTCANALGYSYHLNICSDPQRKQLLILCPRAVWAQTPHVYWKAEITSAHMMILIASWLPIGWGVGQTDSLSSLGGSPNFVQYAIRKHSCHKHHKIAADVVGNDLPKCSKAAQHR